MSRECKCEEMRIYRLIGAVKEQQYQNDEYAFGVRVDTEKPC